MKMKISAIADQGNLEKERVVLRVQEDLDLTYYALFRCIRGANDIVRGGDIPNVWWWSARKVKAGDYIVLYSKDGKRSEKINGDGSTSYFYYWGQSTPIWTPKYRAACVNTSTWQQAPLEDILPEE